MSVSNEAFQVAMDAKNKRIAKLENGLRDVVENCTLANQGHATSGSYRAIGLLAAKALSSAE